MITIKDWNTYSPLDKMLLTAEAASVCGLSHKDCIKLAGNIDLLTAFFQIAHEVAKKRDHYSAYIIVQVLRHNSLVSDNDEEYKINNNITPLLARVAIQLFPVLNGFFKIKSLKKESVK